LVLPSLRECGGTVLLEAMAAGVPCIATNWGGPGHYLDDSCGIRVDPASPEAFVAGLTDAMLKLAESPELRRQMGLAARRRVRSTYFDWGAKADRMLEILRATANGGRAEHTLTEARRALPVVYRVRSASHAHQGLL
jgi:glycosyltransferase involved in cell wall biosynthesis